tara:strand:- start:142 stop:1005 length:864 start_codon:yes stop_codon:yes gene_type:complete
MRQLKIEHSLTNRTEKSIEQYFTDVNKFDSITPEREVELSMLIKEGDQKALEELVQSNLKFVISVAKKYQNTGLPLADLINEGNLGLIKAAGRFDGTRGFKFISFAVWWIRQTIIQAISEKKRMIKVPSNKNLEAGKYFRAVQYLQQRLEREPSEFEVCEYMDIDVESGKLLQQAGRYHSSLDATVGSDESSSTLVNLIEDSSVSAPDSSLLDDSLKKDMYRAFEVLTSNEALVVRYTYGIDCEAQSKEEIARKLGYSNERIRQIARKAEKKLLENTSTKELLIKYL